MVDYWCDHENMWTSKIWEMVLYYCHYVSHVCCVYLSCMCYEHILCVDTHAHTHTFLKIVTFISYCGHTLFFWVFKLLWWCSQALPSCWDVAPCHWVIVAHCFWDMMIPASRGKCPVFFKGHLTSEDGTTMLTQNIGH